MTKQEEVQKLVERRAEALRKAYMPHGVVSWGNTPYKEYWITLATATLDDPDLALIVHLSDWQQGKAVMNPVIPLAEALKEKDGTTNRSPD